MKNIQKLPQNLINRIAAGEVIERPSCAVKELIENSIDANATSITIEIEQAGKQLIRVQDNGEGIPPNQLPLAIEPHATSKISNDQDLFQIQTLGFRGEALASIAAISHLTIYSRPKNLTQGAKLQPHLSPIPQPCQIPPGTIVEIRDLFFHNPARRKFLKSNPTELRHILETTIRLALPHPHIEFLLKHNKKNIVLLPPVEQIPQRIAKLFHQSMAENLIPLQHQQGPYQAHGWIAPPTHSRKDRNWQYFFLNKRFIKDKILNAALKEATKDIFLKDRHPAAFLFLQIPPELVDVNVHPRKLEARFLEEKQIFQLVYHTVRQALNIPHIIPTLELPPKHSTSHSPPSPSIQTPPTYLPQEEKITQSITEPILKPPTNPPPQPPSNTNKISLTPIQDAAFELFHSPTTPQEPPELQHITKLFQLHNSYILAEVPQGLLIIDQHALHEKILYMKLKQQSKQNSPTPSQQLLIPKHIPLSLSEIQLLKETLPLFQNAGFQLTIQEPQTLVLHAIPQFFPEHPNAFADTLSTLTQTPYPSLQEDQILATLACKAAIKQGKSLSTEEIQHLLQQAQQYPHTYTCAHGRPTYLHLPLSKLELKFGRKGG